MRTETRTIGSGCTQFQQTTYFLDGEVHDLSPREIFNLFSKQSPFVDKIQHAREWATSVLIAANLPIDDRLYVKSDGGWQLYLGETGRAVSGLSVVDDDEAESKEWYASRVLRNIDRLNECSSRLLKYSMMTLFGEYDSISGSEARRL